MLSARNGAVGKKVIKEDAILVTLDKDFLQMKKEIKTPS
jgi:predicted nuclease of predicted toxin-antitoxin system